MIVLAPLATLVGPEAPDSDLNGRWTRTEKEKQQNNINNVKLLIFR